MFVTNCSSCIVYAGAERVKNERSWDASESGHMYHQQPHTSKRVLAGVTLSFSCMFYCAETVFDWDICFIS